LGEAPQNEEKKLGLLGDEVKSVIARAVIKEPSSSTVHAYLRLSPCLTLASSKRESTALLACCCCPPFPPSCNSADNPSHPSQSARFRFAHMIETDGCFKAVSALRSKRARTTCKAGAIPVPPARKTTLSDPPSLACRSNPR